MHQPESNAKRQKMKQLRKIVTPFIGVECSVATQQLRDCHDFVLEIPHALSGWEDQRLKDLLSSEFVDANASRTHLEFVWDHDDDCFRNKYNTKATWWLASSTDYELEGESSSDNERAAKTILDGFSRTLLDKEPSRLTCLVRCLDSRIRAAGLFANEHMTALRADLCVALTAHDAYAIINEKCDIPDGGIEFDLPPEQHKQVTKSLLSSVRRLHINTGHPPNAELERIVRLAGGSELSRAAVKGIRCTTCRKAAPAKSPKPGKPRVDVGQFNETVLSDLAYVKDSAGQSHGYCILLDEGTDWCVAKYIGWGKDTKTAEQLYDAVEEGWINWAGPMDRFVADGERGYSAEQFVTKLGKAGTFYQPSAAYAPWQKGRVERKIESFKAIVKKTVLHSGVNGTEMKLTGIEAATSLNQRPGPTGVSPAMMLFGQRLKLYGELYANGEPMCHPDGGDQSTELGRRLQIRNIVRQATEAHFAKELVRKAVSARTRVVENTSVGEIVFFYRRYPSLKAQKLQAQRGNYLGPGVIIGHQGSNLWISFAGRCYLVAPEHVRSLAPDEVASLKPLIRHGLDQLQQASKATDFIDLTGDVVAEEELQRAAALPAGNDYELDDPVQPGAASSAEPDVAEPIVELEPEPVVPELEPEDVQIHEAVERHLGSDVKRKEPEAESPEPVQAAESSAASGTEPEGAVTWQPEGPPDGLRWKKQRPNDDDPQYQLTRRAATGIVDPAVMTVGFGSKRVLTDKVKKKLMDKEIPWDKIPPKDLPLYEKAEKDEWDEWQRRGSVRVCSLKESQEVQRTIDPARIIGLRFVYRDKNASIRTPQTDLPVKAKARLCAQAWNEPLAKAGLIKVDAPTVQRVGVMIFLQFTVNFKWVKHWRKGDVKAAFLQGKNRDVEVNGRLYLRPPKGRPLSGVGFGALLEVLKSVYGLPDAPRAWWDEIVGFLVNECGFQHCRLDPAFLIWYYEDGCVGIILILHVDDIMLSNDGEDVTEAIVNQIYNKYPFGEWVRVSEVESITYTGRTIEVKGNEVLVHQKDFIDGRMTDLPIKKAKNRSKSDLATEVEKADFKSGCGDLHWVTSQTRVDHAVDTSRLQKRQSNPTYGDYLDLGRVIREVKSTADFALRIRPIENPVVAAWTDSALYGAEGELLEDEDDLEGYDRHKIFSQRGALVGLISRDHLEDVGDVPLSVLDWRTRAAKRVFHATFAAESQAAVDTYGLAKYLRAYWCDILLGFTANIDVTSYGEDQMEIILYTDCKSLFDHLKKDGAVPDDKWIAVAVASLKCAVSSGSGRNLSKSECRWIASRWQLADCLTKSGLGKTLRAILDKGSTRLHELSLQQVKKKNKPGAYFVGVMFWEGNPQQICVLDTSPPNSTEMHQLDDVVIVESIAVPVPSFPRAEVSEQPEPEPQTDSLESTAMASSAMTKTQDRLGTAYQSHDVEEVWKEEHPGVFERYKADEHTHVPEQITEMFREVIGSDMDPYFINVGERRHPLVPLSRVLTEYYYQLDSEIADLAGRLEHEFPFARSKDDGTPSRIQLFIMRERMHDKHPNYLKEKDAKKRGVDPVYHTLVVWVGVVVDKDYHHTKEAPTKYVYSPHFDMSGYHGTPLPMALMLLQSGECLRQVGKDSGDVNRTRGGDKVKPNQAYIAEFDTARYYTMPMTFQGDLANVVTVAVVLARHTKKQQGCKHDKIVIASYAKPMVWLFKIDDAEILPINHRYMKNWEDPWEKARQLQANQKQAAKDAEVPWRSEQKPQTEQPKDLDLEGNSKAMSRVIDQQAFKNVAGESKERQIDTVTDESRKPDPVFVTVRYDEEWPTEESEGSTFSYDRWKIYREEHLAEGGTVTQLRPYGADSMTDTDDEPRVVARRPKPNDAVSEPLLKDLRSLRDGQISPKDRLWKSYSFQELAFALRRGSPSLHLHLATALTSRFRQSKQRLTGFAEEVTVREELQSAVDERATSMRSAGHSMRLSSMTESVDEVRAELAAMPKHPGEEVKDHIRNIDGKLEFLKERIVEIRTQTPATYVDPVRRRAELQGTKSRKILNIEEANRIGSALYTVATAIQRVQQFGMLQAEWFDRFEGVQGADPHVGFEIKDVTDQPELWKNPCAHIEDDIEQEVKPDKVAKRPALTVRELKGASDEGARSTPPWKRSAKAVETIDGRYHPKGLKRLKSEQSDKSEVPCWYEKSSKGCRYGDKCSYMHERKQQTVEDDAIVGKECKYYRTSKGCRFGDACKFNHYVVI